MLGYMNDEALLRTIETGEAHYWSRSRQCLWRKGATSGLVQEVVDTHRRRPERRLTARTGRLVRVPVATSDTVPASTGRLRSVDILMNLPGSCSRSCGNPLIRRMSTVKRRIRRSFEGW